MPIAVIEKAGVEAGGLSQPGRAVAAVGAMMAILWVTEALPIAVTALFPIALFPLVTGGAITIRSAAAPYAHELIFLFMGGFMLALAMQRCNLHRRIALRIILLVGTRPDALVGGFMLATAILSMWVSNTATVVMMLPIAMSVVELVRRELKKARDPDLPPDGLPFNFAVCLMLGTAYASSIGGIGTLIGTPPNALLAAFLETHYEIKISFVRWLGIGLPLVVVFLPITWFVITKIVFPIHIRKIPGGRELIRMELESQGPMSRAEMTTLAIFLLTAAAWIARPLLVTIELPGQVRPFVGISDAGIAMTSAILLFAVPVNVKQREFLLTWDQARKLPWGILILFGGGLSLASAIRGTGVAEFIGHHVAGLQYLSTPLLILLVTTVVVFLTELTSNTATTATFLPVLAAVADGLGIDPLLLLVPMTIGASCAFMMPVATPPNAVVFASGEITIPQMCKTGIWLNLIGISLVMLLMYGVVIHLFATAMPG